MNLKKIMLERIEKNGIKLDVEGERIYLKKSKDWHVIYPPVNIKSYEDATHDGVTDWKKVKWNYTNLIFGGKQNAIRTLVIGLITLCAAFGAWQLIASYNVLAANPIIQSCAKQAGIVLQGI